MKFLSLGLVTFLATATATAQADVDKPPPIIRSYLRLKMVR